MSEQQVVGIAALLVIVFLAWVIGKAREELKQLELIKQAAEQQGFAESGLTLVDFVTAKLRSTN